MDKYSSSFIAHHSSLISGLVHLGGGEWYDPSLGRPLQPNSLGGPPSVPQALNRYAATSLGQPGVAAGVAQTALFLSWLGEQTIKTPVGLGLGELAGDALAIDFRIKRTVRYRSFVSKGGKPILNGFDMGVPRDSVSRRLSSWDQLGYTYSRQVSRKATSVIREYTGIAPAVPGSSYRDVEIITEEARFAPRYIGYKGLLADFGIGLVLDVGFQAYGDYDNPYLTTRQKIRRGEIAAAGSLGVTAIGLGIRGGLMYLGVASGPAGWIALAGTLLVDFTWELGMKPVIFEFFGATATRSLHPLQE